MTNAQSGSPKGGAGDLSPTGNSSGLTTNPKMRKRTKTGCLTCRKRRIKCGEERPTCGNCIKSKRQCEGYNQRVIFKTPLADWPNHPGVVSTMQYHSSMLPGTRNQTFRPPQPVTQGQDNTLTSIQPRPTSDFDFSSLDQSFQRPLPPPHHQPFPSPHHQAHLPTMTTSYIPQPSTVHTAFPVSVYHDTSLGYEQPQPYPRSQATFQQSPVTYDGHGDSIHGVSQALPQPPLYQQRYDSSDHSEDQNSYISHSSVSPQSDHHPQIPDQRSRLQRYGSQTQNAVQQHVGSVEMDQTGPYHPAAPANADFIHSSFHSFQMPKYNMTSDVKYLPPPVLEQSNPIHESQPTQPQLLLQGFGGVDHVSPTQVLDEAAVEYEDDDYWDVQSDDDMPDREDDADEETMLTSKDFNIIRRIHMENSNELGIRRYDAFLYDGLLSHYKPEYAASPLRNPKTARVFAHFIHVTGPSLSIYERNPRNSTLIFEGSTPAAQQGLWTYILPLKALGHQGLLHAMLALASLHIARLQGASITPSYKHYAYSLKRLGRSLGSPQKRLTIPTLATSLLLAFYEVWTAEHTKWSTHLIGAAQLVAELDFRSLTREARRLKAAQAAQERQFPYQNPEMLIDQKQLNRRLQESTMMPDERLVSVIIGNKVSYDDFGMVFEENGMRQEKKTSLPGKLDLKSFETLQDLYWWYARHDAWQSMISGNPLITAYRKWSDCPPRAPLGRADALYGTHDHIILLIGRINDFTTRDRERKLRQVRADGAWRPRPGMPGYGNMGPPPMRPGQPPTPITSMGPHPHMQGPPPGWTGPPPPGFGPPGPPTPGSGPPSQGQSPPGGPPPSAMPNFYGMAPSRPHAPLTGVYVNPAYQRSPQTSNEQNPQHANLPAAYDEALEEWNSIAAAHAAISNILGSTASFTPLPPDLCPLPPGRTSTTTPFGPAIVHRSYDISILWTLIHLGNIILLRCHPAMPPAAQMAAGICAPATAHSAQLIGRIAAGMHIPISDDLSPFLGAVLTESTLSLFFAGVQYQDAAQREWLVTRLLEIDRRTGWATAGIIARGCETAWEKAAGMGRGPLYERRTTRAGEEGPLRREVGGGTDWRAREGNAGEQGVRVVSKRPEGYVRGGGGDSRLEDRGQEGSGDRRYVVRSQLAPWAMNLLGTEEDLRAGIERIGL
ncbi:hypothetical protein P153DRAFT_360618 [Dothidotthia symphoricarpi CBS 119687]|uniref:Zn(2)-C6 fungal-type domain-containing protein n=1 Tax=Dothidotthia symphoricarpi CBS 119687 TaxID=1392245 RepID=A0A6A6A0E0_9PLEO|nr:uncharacterized protein P153DRAFT_360618 [Dothidotthia symphoricarpi CBS 119687]KAF2124986.1 hypothetical protein P153DRAFT_360618 [Dothidotthia symphoricarpi CBS 119687]